MNTLRRLRPAGGEWACAWGCTASGPGDREVLAALLVPGWPAAAVIGHDGLGRPVCPEGAENWLISFSRSAHGNCEKLTYGAVAQTSAAGIAGLGIDVAHPAEFAGPYPEKRVFTRSELTLLDAVSPERGAVQATAWSVKEAAVKALGIGFHYAEPRDVEIRSCRPGPCGLELRVRVVSRGRIHELRALSLTVRGCQLSVVAGGVSGSEDGPLSSLFSEA